MVQYRELRKHKRRFLALTGLTDKEFKAILPWFQKAHEASQAVAKTQKGKKRKRAVGGGRKAKLETIEDRLLFVLMYQKSYPVQELLGITFGMSQSSVNHWVHRLLPELKRALEQMGVMPERKGKALARSEQATGESPDLIVDATERKRQRPKDAQRQKDHYSGKRKAHTDKNLIISQVKSNRVAYLSPTYPGKTHDKKVADQEAIRYPKETHLHQDTGFQGYKPKVKQISQPKKTTQG
jgi:Helix-turn-helix of DDE superfamily endonuclease/DDE superfamily endonuclease